jgi:hypothetical protein
MRKIRVGVFLLVSVAVISGSAICVAAKKPPKEWMSGMTVRVLGPVEARDLRLPEGATGVLICAVLKGSPADEAGLLTGDLIIRAGTEQVSKGEQLVDLLRKRRDKPLELAVLRHGETLPFTVKLRQYDPSLLYLENFQPVAPRERPRTIVVAADGTGDFRTLQAANLEARPGDTVYIKPGSYGGFEIFRDNITLQGEDRAKVVIGQVGVPFGRAAAAVGQARPARLRDVCIKGVTLRPRLGTLSGFHLEDLEGLKIEDCVIEGARGIGLWLYNVKGIITGCAITGNGGWGIVLYAYCQIRIERNLIASNVGGLFVSTSRAEVEGNTIVNHRSAMKSDSDKKSPRIAAQLMKAADVSLYNNIIAFNDMGVSITGSSNNVCRIECNDIYGNRWYGQDYNVAAGWYGSIAISDTNVSLDPIFVDALNGDFRLREVSPVAMKGLGGTYMGAFPPVGAKPAEGEFK